MTDSKMPKREIGRHTREGSRAFQFTLRVPADLAALYPGKRYACRQSLRTTDAKEANRRSLELRAHWESVFEKQRLELARVEAAAVSTLAAITPEVASEIAEALKHSVLAVDQDLRNNPRKWSISGKDHERLSGMPSHLQETLAESNRESATTLAKAVAAGKLEVALPSAQHAAHSLGLSFDATTPGAMALLQECLKVLRQAIDLCVRRDQGEVVETPPKPAPAIQKKVYRLRDVFDLWSASHGATLSADTVRARELALGLFEEFAGNPTLQEITRLQGNDFRAWLLAKGGATKTANLRFTYVKALLGHAHRELGLLRENPWFGLDIAYATESKRVPWSLTQIRAFFGLALFRHYELPIKQSRAGADAAYWIPLLGLFHGARIGELCQLEVGDITEQDGVWTFDVHDRGATRQVKTAASVRHVPIHSELIRLGFLDYAKAAREAGHRTLWPSLRLLPGKPSHAFSCWFNEVGRKLVSDLELPDFHSFRHTVNSLLARRRVPEAERNLILGHEQSGSEGSKTYLHVDLSQLREVIEAVTYQGLMLPRVYEAGRAPATRKQRASRKAKSSNRS